MILYFPTFIGMEEERKIDFKRHASPPASKKYILKIIFYVIFLGGLVYMIISQTNKTRPLLIEIDGKSITLGE